ncbi:MAG: SulP family inorganic anion transporter [Planctomycetes bacterium]|nr:SulP family inorganic anion transporter [Planctomycetota bacterium]
MKNQLDAQWWKADFLASLVVFLVALPLCMGIAIASGAPPIAGILSGVIGGIVVALLGGSPMLVSGPANGLIVLVLLITQQHGLAVLGVIVLAAGLLQVLAGSLGLGQLFRAIPPSIIHGLMTGFAVIIFASQFHVMLDDPVRTTALENLIYIPVAIWDAAVNQDGSHRAAIIGVLTILILLLWKPLVPKHLAFVPASLVGVAVATAVVAFGNLSVARVNLPSNLLDAVQLVDLSLLPRLLEWPILELALVMAFLASTETLLSATAVDRLHQGPRTNYDRELTAQGIGNMLCGILGAIPLTGVVIRSAANVAAGARTRWSSVLHGVWLLVFVAALPSLLKLIPTASLAAVLLIAVFKLVDVKALKEIWRHDKREIGIYAVTAATVFFWGVLPGVLLGIGLALAKLLYSVGHLNIRVEEDPDHGRTNLYLEGTAVFLNLPKLASVLETVPAGTELHVHIENLNLIDHACLDLLANWEHQHRSTGGELVLDWESLPVKFGRQFGLGESNVSAEPWGSSSSGPEQRRRFSREGWQPLYKKAS